ncbi:MAG: replicative DNA helicase [Bacilli bacterium]|nr:replicative DNA helicase [Bacilli bacterium]
MAKRVRTDLPYNADAERAVLGSAFLTKEALYSVLSRLDEEDFYEGKHQIIYRALASLQKKSIAVDILTVTEELINAKEIENVGGAKYLQECADSMVAISSLEFYMNIVKDQAVLRNLLINLREIDNRYKTEEIEDVDSFIASAEEQIKAATEKRRISTFKSAEEVAKVVAMSLQTQQKLDDENVTGLTTGYDNINKLTNGFQKTELTIIAARPSVGKTALALNFAYKAATRKQVPVAIFSLEMASELLVRRLVAADSNVPLQHISTGTLSGQERAKVASAIKTISAAPIYIDDSPGIKLMDIIAKSRQLQSQHPDLGLIVVDYLGLITTGNTSKGNDSRQEEVRKISLALKGLARDLKVPVVVLSQLSRDVEKRDTKKPMLSDLRDSGSIEQDADVVMLLYREDYYKNSKKETSAGNKKMGKLTQAERFEMVKAAQEKQLGEAMPGDASYIEVNIAKNRNGQTGTCGLFFYKAFGRFELPSPEWEEQMANIRAGEEID